MAPLRQPRPQRPQRPVPPRLRPPLPPLPPQAAPPTATTFCLASKPKRVLLAVQTAPRDVDMLPGTLASLQDAGVTRWVGPTVVFADGCEPDVPWPFALDASKERLGNFGNFLRILRATAADPSLDGVLLIEDDVLLCRNTLPYIQCLMMPDWASLMALYCSRGDLGARGLVRQELGGFCGNCAIYMPMRTVAKILASHMVDFWTKTRRDGADEMITETLGPSTYCVNHLPNLAQHVGEISTMGVRHIRRSPTFPGENFDALSLVPPLPPSTQDPRIFGRRESRRIHVLVEWYADRDAGRSAELRACLENNLANTHVERVHVMGLQGDLNHLGELAQNSKLALVPRLARTTFEDFFRYASTELAEHPCAVLNADVHFDDTLRLACQADLRGHLLALTRWDVLADGKLRFLDRSDSADAWIFEAPVKIPACAFNLGTPGCDNKIAYLAARAGFLVSNPSRSIILHHLHLSGKRNYNAETDRIPGPYDLVYPSGMVFAP